MIDLGPLHFLRPAWLLALAALPLLALLIRRVRRTAGDWRRAIDPHLLPFLLEPGAARRRRLLAGAAIAAYALASVALAGPAWREVEQPTWQTREPLVVAVDLSSAVLATDVAPSRAAQLRARLQRLLQAHRDGPIALVAYADDAFTVAPLTDDAANVALFVDALQPDVMPVDGQRPARAIAWSRQLIERAGYARGRIVLVTDHADAAAVRAAAEAQAAGIDVAAVGLGTPSGATVRTPSGGTVQVALDESSLRALARAGGGDYARLSLDGGDDAAFAAGGGGGAQRGHAGGRSWADDGARVVPFVMLLALVVLVRRPRAAALLLVVALLPRPAPAADVWVRGDQRAFRSVERGIELYRRGQFDRAAEAFAKSDTADAHYDRGNALAKAGRLEDAIAAYDEALHRRPGMADAIANRKAVVAAMKRRQQQNEGSRQSGQQGDASKQSQQPRNCASNDAACLSRNGAQPPEPGPQQRTPPSRSNAAIPSTSAAPKPADPQRQAQADAAQREQMQRALQQAREQKARQDALRRMTPAQRERRLADEAALMRVPDDPGSLLREKFRLEYERRQLGGGR